MTRGEHRCQTPVFGLQRTCADCVKLGGLGGVRRYGGAACLSRTLAPCEVPGATPGRKGRGGMPRQRDAAAWRDSGSQAFPRIPGHRFRSRFRIRGSLPMMFVHPFLLHGSGCHRAGADLTRRPPTFVCRRAGTPGEPRIERRHRVTLPSPWRYASRACPFKTAWERPSDPSRRRRSRGVQPSATRRRQRPSTEPSRCTRTSDRARVRRC